MWLAELRLRNLRGFAALDIELDPGINLFTGANGAGKTTLLEAAYLLSHGHSFRSGSRDALLRLGGDSVCIFGRCQRANQQSYRLGLERESTGPWNARVDERSVALTELLARCAVVSFDPGSHELIAGSPEIRRAYLDWGVFHVEPGFVQVWRRYQRALRQRNSLLKQNGTVAELESWESELAGSGEHILISRRTYAEALRPALERLLRAWLPELGNAELEFKAGWPTSTSLADVLARERERDRDRGHTRFGAHRADWNVVFERAPDREHLSRGQEKLLALACIQAQAELYFEQHSEWPVICLDDFGAELDGAHQALLADHLAEGRAQVLVTGTEAPTALLPRAQRRFHVEPGRVATLL